MAARQRAIRAVGQFVTTPVDSVLEGLAGFVDTITAQDLPAKTVHQVKRRITDSIGCMIGGSDQPASRLSRRLAGQVCGQPAATVTGLARASTVEMAAFANTVMTRVLDFNDTTFTDAGGGGHFSDMIPALFAAAEAGSATGADLILGVAVAYEIAASLAAVTRLRERGWDYSTWITIASAMACGKLVGLNREQLAHAASIAAISSISTRQMRVGELSMWKGCASAAANRNGVFAALLAREGMTAPAEPFAGKDGIMDLVTGTRFTLPLGPAYRPPTYAVELSNFKIYPSGYNTQGPGELMLHLRDRIRVDDVDAIDVATYWLCYSENGMEPAKWDPRTRETADHSLPYVLAIALADGELTLDSFAESRFTDPALRPLLKRIVVTESEEYSQRFPAELNTSITVRLRTGEVVSGHTAHAYGHHLNPPTDEAISRKFDGLCRAAADPALCAEIRDACWDLDRLGDVTAIMSRLAGVRPR
jgi:2-methylcitrate dehydratase